MSRHPLLVLALCAAAALAPSAQERAQPVYRVGSELVVVDVVATDRAGNNVVDLQPSEIRVVQDGKPQTIDFVRLVRGGDLPRAATGSPPPPGGGEPAGGATGAAVRVALVLDLGSMPPDTFPRVREAIRQMVRDQLPDGASVMLATLSPGVAVRQAFTTDRKAVLAAVDALPLSLGGKLTVAEIVEKVENACDLAGTESLKDSAVAVARTLVAESRHRLKAATNGLVTLSRTLAALEGRKHVVLYSAGYFTNPVADAADAVAASVSGCTGVDPSQLQRTIAQDITSLGGDDVGLIHGALDRANRSQVSFYAIDPRGLVTTNVAAQQRGSARMARGGAAQKVLALDQLRSQEYLQTLAAGTSGRAFLNTNDLTAGLRRAWLDASEYYLIGYTPSGSKKKGQFHRIEVKVARPDLDVRYRRGYYEATEQELARKDVEAALADPWSFPYEGFEVEARVEGERLWVTTFIPPSAIRFVDDGGAQKADFSVHGTLRDDKGKLVGGKAVIGRDLGVRLNPVRVAELVSSGSKLEIRTDIDPPKAGKYQMVVVARDSGGWIAARSVELTVPQ